MSLVAKVTEDTEKRTPQGTEEAQLPFDSLGIRVGDPLHLEGMDQSGRYHVKLIGYLPGQGILVTMPVNEGRQVLLKKDRPFTVRSIARTSAFAFHTAIKQVCTQPFPYLCLEYPKDLLSVQIRNASRLKVDMPTTITSEFDPGTGEWPKDGMITDISKSGAGVKSMSPLGAEGDEIILQFLVSVSGVSKTFKLKTIIRNKSLMDDSELPYKYLYGLQYLELSDAAKIVLSGFIYELQGLT